MAGDWIPYTLDLPKKLEVIRIASATGISRRECVGILLEFWGWCDSETEDGFLPGIRIGDLSDICPVDVRDDAHKCPYSPDKCPVDVRHFFRAVADVGWLVESGEGVEVVNFDRYMSKSAKARMADARRKKKKRHGQILKRPVASAKCPKPSGQNADKSRTTKQNRTEQTIPPTSPRGEQHAPALAVVQHYAEVVGKPGMDRGDALVLVMRLLASGVKPDELNRAADTYAIVCRSTRTMPMGPAEFFESNWEVYLADAPKAKRPTPRMTIERARVLTAEEKAAHAELHGHHDAKLSGTSVTGPTTI